MKDSSPMETRHLVYLFLAARREHAIPRQIQMLSLGLCLLFIVKFLLSLVFIVLILLCFIFSDSLLTFKVPFIF